LGISETNPAQTLVYATVLYWQAQELPLVERCVASLLRQESGPGLELRVIVVDNGCGATPRLPSDARLELIHTDTNLGFAGGHNVGMRKAMASGADYMFVFNSDAVAEPDCVRELVTAARDQPSTAFVGPLIVSEASPERIESAGQSFNTWTARHHELSRGGLAAAIELRPRNVDAVSGCAMLVCRAAADSIGLLDERLFIYFEDMDWCLRARRAGYTVLVAPRARVSHLGQGSTGRASPFTTFYSVRNHMVVAARQAGPIRGPALMVLALGYHLAFVASSRERRNTRHLTALAQGAWAAWTGQLGARRSSADWN
jgi:GT2 family glycosyltransferase